MGIFDRQVHTLTLLLFLFLGAICQLMTKFINVMKFCYFNKNLIGKGCCVQQESIHFTDYEMI